MMGHEFGLCRLEVANPCPRATTGEFHLQVITPLLLPATALYTSYFSSKLEKIYLKINNEYNEHGAQLYAS